MARKTGARRTAPVRSSKKVPVRSRLDVDERRGQLLALGLAMFSERPYDDVSVDALAQAAGVSKGLLYHYFPTKRDLYVAALREAARQLLEQTTPDSSAASEERVRRGLETYLDYVESRGPAYVALLRGGLGSDPEIAAILEETRATFAARIADNLPQGSVTPLVHTALRGWIGFVEATSVERATKKSIPRDELVALLAGVLFDTIVRVGVVPVETA